MAQSIDISDLVRLNKRLSDVVSKRKIRAVFKQEHRAAGQEMRQLVRSNLPGSKKVALWQIDFHGSKGGYAAVRSQRGKYKGYAKGHITNAIENGHRPPGRARNGKKNPRIVSQRTLNIPGLGFYAEARSHLKEVGQKHAENLERKIEELLQGLGR